MGNMAKILIVDDEEDVRESFRRFLENEKYAVSEAATGRDALKLLDKKKFDVVILDILMPGMTGVELGQAIRNNPKTKDQKIIFATVISPGQKDSDNIQQIKPEAYITKPFKLVELKKAIGKALGAKH